MLTLVHKVLTLNSRSPALPKTILQHYPRELSQVLEQQALQQSGQYFSGFLSCLLGYQCFHMRYLLVLTLETHEHLSLSSISIRLHYAGVIVGLTGRGFLDRIRTIYTGTAISSSGHQRDHQRRAPVKGTKEGCYRRVLGNSTGEGH